MMRRRNGFTLVELLVAIALGTILIGVVTFVWMQSTRIFSSTVNYLETRQYWRDEVYVRTYISARGTSVPAMVHYRLVPEADGRSAIRRRVWYTDAAGGIVNPATNALQATDQFALLATGLCDLKFG